MGFGQQFLRRVGESQFTNPYDPQGDGEDDDYITRLRKRQLEGTGDRVEQTVQNSPNLPWAPGQDSINITRNSTNIGYGGSSPAGRVSPTTPSFNPGGGGGGGGGYPYGSMIYGRPDDLGGGGGGGTSVNSTWYPGTYGGGGGGGTTVDSSWYPGPYYTGVGGGSPFPDWTEKDWNEYLASMGL